MLTQPATQHQSPGTKSESGRQATLTETSPQFQRTENDKNYDFKETAMI